MIYSETQKENLKKIQDVELKMLDEIDRICKKYNLDYSLSGGTLLGAIRHDDFIPWDDDIDIDLKRDDFFKLIEILPKELPEEYQFINYSDFGEYFCDFIPRIFYNNCNVHNSFLSDDGKTNLVNDERINGIFVELYCLHNTNSKTVKKQIFKTKLIYGLAMGHRYYKFKNKNYSFIEKAEVFLLSSLGKLIPMKKITAMYEKNCSRISSEGNLYFKPSVPLPVQEKNIFQKEWFDSYCMHKIRNTYAKIPTAYEKVLVSLYGDWRKLPPEEDRKPSHFNLDDVIIY